MRLLAASQSGAAASVSLDTIRGVLEQKKVGDAWGKPIILRQQGDRVVLISAGPDQQFDTGDDILQYVTTRKLIQE